jgi:predicted nucleic acid-binding protein
MEIVIDASTLLKAYFPDEEGSKKAEELLFFYSTGKLDLIVPSLIDYEISNAIFVAYKRNRITFDEAKEIQEKIINLDIKKLDFNFFKQGLLDICKRFNISVYDASYLFLSVKSEIKMVTGDKRLFNTVKDKHKNIVWIGDFNKIF